MPTRREQARTRRRRFLVKAHARAGRDPHWIARALRRPVADICAILRIPVPPRPGPHDAAIRAVLRRLRRMPAIRTLTDLADWCGCAPKAIHAVLATHPDRDALLALLRDRQHAWREQGIADAVRRLYRTLGRPPGQVTLRRAGISTEWITIHYGSIPHFLRHLGLPTTTPNRGAYRPHPRPLEPHDGVAGPTLAREGPGGPPRGAEIREPLLRGPEIRREGRGL